MLRLSRMKKMRNRRSYWSSRSKKSGRKESELEQRIGRR